MSLERKQRLLSAQSKKSSNRRKRNIRPKSEKHQVSHSWHNSNLRPECIRLAQGLQSMARMLLQHCHLSIQQERLLGMDLQRLIKILTVVVVAVVVARAVALLLLAQALHLLLPPHLPPQDPLGRQDHQDQVAVDTMEGVTRY